jgi:hypothetical protein
MKKYRVTLTRLVEEECCIYVDAKDQDEASAKALDLVEEIADMIWASTNAEPHSYSVDTIKDAEELQRGRIRAEPEEGP